MLTYNTEVVIYQAQLKLQELAGKISTKVLAGKDSTTLVDLAYCISCYIQALCYAEYLEEQEIENITTCLVKVACINEFPPNVGTCCNSEPPAILMGIKGEKGEKGDPGDDANINVIGEDPIFVTEEDIEGVRTFIVAYDPYIAPSLVVTINGQGSIVREAGTEIVISVGVLSVKGRDPITYRELILPNGYFNPLTNEPEGQPIFEVATPTDTVQHPTPNSGIPYLKTYTGAVSDNTSTELNNGDPVVTASAVLTFFHPYLYGASDVTTQNPYALSGKLIQGVGNKTVTLNGTNKYFYFCYPNTYPTLYQILDQNGFDVTDSWTLQPVLAVTSTTSPTVWTTNYKVYRTTLKTTINSADFTFKYS